MPVAEMPGDPHQACGIRGGDLGQRFGRCHDLDQPAGVKHQRVAATKRHRLREIEQEMRAFHAGHGGAPPVALVEIEHDAILRGALPTAPGPHARRAQDLAIHR